MGDLVRLAKAALKQQQMNAGRPDLDAPAESGPEQGKDIVIEPAHPFAKLTYFEDVYGRILGPVIPEFLAKADGHLKTGLNVPL